MTYEGQPDYVIAGFLTDLFREWLRINDGNEWGELIIAMWNLADAAIRVSDEEKALMAVNWLREEFQAAFEDEWWGMANDYLPDIVKARDAYDPTVAYWRQRSVSFKGEAALETVIAELPDWIKPASPEVRDQARLHELEEQEREAQHQYERAVRERERFQQRSEDK